MLFSKKIKRINWIVIGFFIIVTFIIFRNYFVFQQVPFPANLLVQFYEPWASYPKEGYAVGPTQKPIGFDSIRIFYPTRKIVTEQIAQLDIPLWNPYSFSGNVLHATYQSAVFFPLSFLFLILPVIDAWSLIVILQPIFTGIFTYLFLRELSLGKKASLFGALTYAFCGIMIVWWEEMFMAVYAMLVLPLACYAIHKLYRQRSRLDFIILFGALSSSILAGWLQATLYVFICSLLWAVFLYFFSPFSNKRAAVIILFGFILSVLFSAIQLVPAFEIYMFSARQYLDTKEIFNEFLSPVSQLITFIAPDFFGNPGAYNYFGEGFYHEKALWIGIPALLFLVYEVLSIKKTSSVVRFFLGLGIIVLSLGFNFFTTWFFLYTLHPPFLSETTPGRIFFLSSFCFAVVAAFGIDRYLKNPNIIKLFITVSIVLSMFVGSFTFLLTTLNATSYNVALRNMIIPTILFGLTTIVVFFGLIKKIRTAAWGGIILISLIGILYFTNKYLYFSERRFVFPEISVLRKLQDVSGVDRFWSFGKGKIFSNLSSVYGLYSLEGYDSLNIARYNELLFSSHTRGKFTKLVPRNDATIYPINLLEEINKDTSKKRLFSLLGVKYLVGLHASHSAMFTDAPFELLWSDRVYDIYVYKEALPRFFLANNFIVEKNSQKIINLLFDNDFDIKTTLILEEKPKNFSPNKINKGRVELISYEPNKVRFRVTTEHATLLFLSDNHYPGWKSFIDGKENKIYRTNYSFRSVIVPSGLHVVTFVFQPISFFGGLIISVIGFLLFLVVLTKKVWTMV